METIQPKKYLSYRQCAEYMKTIIGQMNRDQYVPDYIIPIIRGGLTPGLYLSYHYNVPIAPIVVQLRDGNSQPSAKNFAALDELPQHAKILVVDDINDSGKTLHFIHQRCKDRNVRYAAMLNNVQSTFKPNYIGRMIDKLQDQDWVVFPWEEWYGQHDKNQSV